MRLAFSSSEVRPLADLRPNQSGRIVDVRCDGGGRADRLIALGVTPGAVVKVLQVFPSVVILCDQTELAVERAVADAILVRVVEDAL